MKKTLRYWIGHIDHRAKSKNESPMIDLCIASFIVGFLLGICFMAGAL